MAASVDCSAETPGLDSTRFDELHRRGLIATYLAKNTAEAGKDFDGGCWPKHGVALIFT